ncbi:MAG: hypothetical protein R3C49_20750 [Planctomycetaceae bacterium]
MNIVVAFAAEKKQIVRRVFSTRCVANKVVQLQNARIAAVPVSRFPAADPAGVAISLVHNLLHFNRDLSVMRLCDSFSVQQDILTLPQVGSAGVECRDGIAIGAVSSTGTSALKDVLQMPVQIL